MSKKDFKNTINPINAFIGGAKEEKTSTQKKATKKTKEANAPTENIKNENTDFSNYNFKTTTKILNRVKACASVSGLSIRDTIEQAILEYFKNHKDTVNKADEILKLLDKGE